MAEEQLMTVGELAKKMDVTVRALQYYDREGLLVPSYKSGGGRRLYSNQDMVKLHQILSLKFLGFSIEQIKTNLISLDSPEAVAEVLLKQGEAIEAQMDRLSEALTAVRALQDEVRRMKQVDFGKYADIIVQLRRNNKEYWILKLFDKPLTDHIRSRFSDDPGAGLRIFETYQSVCDETVILIQQGECPSGEKGQAIAKIWWDMILDFTGGDLSLLPELMKFNNRKEDWDEQMRQQQLIADPFIGEALDIYLKKLNQTFPDLEETQK